MLKIRIFILASILLAAGTIKAQNWKPNTASCVFKIKMLGSSVQGSFKGFQGKIVFDPAALETAQIFGTVEAATIETNNTLRNRHLREKKEFFDAAKHPKLKLQSKRIWKSGNAYLATFDFTIRNITKEVQLPLQVKIEEESKTAQFSTQFTINRKDWALGGNTLGMGNDVQIILSVNTTKN
jgi:polyisoprenoid-binding protein YceI